MIVKNKKNKIIKRLIVILLCIVLLSVGSVLAYYFLFKKTTLDTQTQQQADSSQDGTAPKDDKTIIATPEETTDETLEIEKPTITRAEQDSSGKIRVSAIFSSSTSGTCNAVFEKGGEPTITKSAEIIIGPSYYACNGFLVALDDFPTGGEWSVIVQHVSNELIASSDKQTFTITKP